MAVPYVLIERGNPQKPEEPKKFYAQAKNSGEISYKILAKEIASKSSLNAGDVFNVLEVLTQVMNREISDGRIVRLGDFGSLQLSISSDGVEVAEKFNPTHIKNSKIIFRPGKDLKMIMNNIEYKKVAGPPDVIVEE
jgi:predicted histone-like DNA-binding protein